MENSSKALIIAGAVLISILTVGLGVTVYNSAKENSSKQAGDKISAETTNAVGNIEIEGTEKVATYKINITTYRCSPADDPPDIIKANEEVILRFFPPGAPWWECNVTGADYTLEEDGYELLVKIYNPTEDVYVWVSSDG